MDNDGNLVKTYDLPIRKLEKSGCKIRMNNEYNGKIIEIDFINPDENLNKFEPALQRDGMEDVDFIYQGFLVRIRKDLPEFLNYCIDLEFDINIYTSANPIIYQGLLEICEEYLKDLMGLDNNDKIWNDILFREDCQLEYTDKNKPYHHKDLTLFGCDLSRVVMIDNSPIVCHGFEPNFILIKGILI